MVGGGVCGNHLLLGSAGFGSPVTVSVLFKEAMLSSASGTRRMDVDGSPLMAST